MISLGHIVSRRHIRLTTGDLFTDLYGTTARDLIEVKANVDLITIRLALGQILDYTCYIEQEIKTVLILNRLDDDLIGPLHAHDVHG